MLTNYKSVYIPSTRQGNIPLSQVESERIIKIVLTRMSQAFGGCTATHSIGSWLSNTHGLITEPVTIAQSYYDIDPIVADRKVKSIARWIKKELQQESVSIQSNDGLEFI